MRAKRKLSAAARRSCDREGCWGAQLVDNTGISGRLDALHLEYTPDDPATQARLADPTQALGPDEDAPALVTALREQTGLQLQAGKGPVDVLIIDRVEKPSLN